LLLISLASVGAHADDASTGNGGVDQVHYISSGAGKETIRVAETLDSSGQEFYLIDRCNAQKSGCTALVPGKERISAKEIEHQETKDVLKMAAYGVGSFGLDALFVLKNGSIFNFSTEWVGEGGPEAVVGAAIVLNLAMVAKNAQLSYNLYQLGEVNESGSDVRVLSIGSYEKSLAAEISREQPTTTAPVAHSNLAN
jgi:hypothetical protein